MNEDFLDVLTALSSQNARFLVVGAHAMAVHGVPRATGDLDVWIDRDPANVERVWKALQDFGAPLSALGIRRSDLESPDRVCQIGLPPRRIDLLTQISGVEFDRAWESRVGHVVEGLEVPFIGREMLIQNKKAAGRLKDLADVEILEGKREEPPEER